MTTATITKILNKLINNSDNQFHTYSLGFQRYYVLPNKLKRQLDLALFLKYNTTNIFEVRNEFFKEMTDKEYILYLRQS